MKPLAKKYNHKEAEQRWHSYWEEKKIYAWEPDQPRENTYVIDTPPPTVSGILHMGHIFSYTQADFIARYQRMAGKTVFYPMGFDDNGLPTERLVEKVKKIKAHRFIQENGREAFIEVCKEVVVDAENEFRRLFKSVALSVDWSQEYQTISERSRKISQLSFLDLYHKDKAYRKLQPMLWDPVDQTAIAQAEVEDKEMPSHMNVIRFKVLDEDGAPLLSSPRQRGEGVPAAATEAIPSPAGWGGSGRGPSDEKAHESWKNSKELIANARSLRKDPTDVEKKLWYFLRREQLKGHKFRRQHPIERYVADFACLEAKLILELDGDQHGWDENQKKEAERSHFLEKRGFRILRFANHEVNQNLEGVLETIWNALPDEKIAEGEGSDGSAATDELLIATTRPELIPACVGVFYHPEDERYQHLKGKQAVTPLFGVKVPIMEDESVEMDKGTGIMMCCTFGDEADIEKWRKHDLLMRVILNKYGKIDYLYEGWEGNPDYIYFYSGEEGKLDESNTVNLKKAAEYLQGIAGKKVSNKDPKHPGARELVIQMLDEAGLLVKSEPITHAVKCAERSGSPLEILPTPQWFVKVLDQKEALKAKASEAHWYPEFMKLRMEQWIDGLNWDWCISRQRYFGVPFPIWYSKRPGEEGKQLVAEPDQLPVNPLVDLPRGYSREEVEPDMDVMDTWATSSVSPQLSSWGINRSPLMGEHTSQAQSAPASGGGENQQSIPPSESANADSTPPPGGSDNPYVLDQLRHTKLFPADLRPQAHEIIRTWAFYTLVKAHYHENSLPWQNLMISGWCLASDKTKMSKSKGNVITPVDLIENNGADAVRYWASTSRLGMDTAFSEDLLKIGKKLVTKLWNATKFASMHLDKLEKQPETAKADVKKGLITETLDLWVLTRLQRAVERSTQEFERYEYATARTIIEDFFWNDFCDNYLELAKIRAYGEGETSRQARQSAIHTLYHCLHTVLRLFAPIVPHITEELFSHIFEEDFNRWGSINARGTWPQTAEYPIHEQSEQSGIACVQVLNAIRRLKSEHEVSIKYPLESVSITAETDAFTLLEPALPDLKNAANASDITAVEKPQNEAVKSEDGRYLVSAVFAEKNEVDAAANS